jgi:hypothetical protein
MVLLWWMKGSVVVKFSLLGPSKGNVWANCNENRSFLYQKRCTAHSTKVACVSVPLFHLLWLSTAHEHEVVHITTWHNRRHRNEPDRNWNWRTAEMCRLQLDFRSIMKRYPILQIERTISGCFHSSLSQLIAPGSDKIISAGVGVRPGYCIWMKWRTCCSSIIVQKIIKMMS